MKTTILIFLFILATFNLFAEKEIELTPIVLPYDSLNIDEVYGYGATIIARSGNTIYHSTDDGASWDIALVSETKLNQLYSKDPHTVFVIGHSGLVYRTFDYGATWFDVSVDTDLELREMVAGDYSEYMIITPRTYTFRKSNQDNNYDYLENRSNVILDNIEYHKGKYYYSGGAIYGGYRVSMTDIDIVTIPLFISENGSTEEILFDDEEVWSGYNFTFFDIKPISVGNNLMFTSQVWSIKKFSSALIKYPRSLVENYTDHFYGIRKNDDIFVYIDVKDTIVTYITQKGELAHTYLYEFDKYLNEGPYESYDLDLEVVNNVFKIQDDDYLIASNNSTIYRTKLVNIPTSIEIETDSNISLYGNVIELNNGIEIVSVTNYLGQGIDVEKVSLNAYRLENGLCFITYIDQKGVFKTIKVMVNE